MKKFLWILLLLPALQLVGQPPRTYTIKDKKAIKTFEEALSQYDYREYENAITTLVNLVNSKPDFIEAQLMLAQIYGETGEIEKAIEPLKKVLALDEKFYR